MCPCSYLHISNQLAYILFIISGNEAMYNLKINVMHFIQSEEPHRIGQSMKPVKE